MHLENLTSPTNGDRTKPLILELVINKDRNGYGMKVSGENPVYVDSVKDGGAAHRAGLHAADMILRVNSIHVRFSSHAEVVQLMKATQNVELTVQRNARNFSMPLGGVCSNLGTPTTPTSQRNSITAPLPVDVSYTRPLNFPQYFSINLNRNRFTNMPICFAEHDKEGSRVHETSHALHDVGAGEKESGKAA